MQPSDIASLIERLVRFGLQRGLLNGELDAIDARNKLLDLFGVAEPYGGELPDEELDSAAPLLEAMLDYGARTGLLPENTTGYRDLLDARIMGLLMPRPSEAAARFRRKAETEGIEAATNWFYRMSIDSNYIRMDRIAKNLYWLADTDYGALEITVNLSKPEKDPKEIAAERLLPAAKYPKCLLCADNVGYAGRLNHPARQNHRILPLTLDGRSWYMQYSPYVYYNEHCIVFDAEHTPMVLSEATFRRLLDFVDAVPHYFIGSNADLPIVGGSILSHDHYQGGRHVFPMEKAPVEETFRDPARPGLSVGIVKWPMSVLRARSRDRGELLSFAAHTLEAWRGYSDPEAGILAWSETDGCRVPHNTITPIARFRSKTGEYELDLVLRNNRRTEEHPDGLFHPHRDLHHIKKENIGLIEVMGLAVLPGRLKDELDAIGRILSGESTLPPEEDKDHPLAKHREWIESLVAAYGNSLPRAEAESLLKREVGAKFARVLEDAGVFKRNPDGLGRFRLFCGSLGLIHA